MRVVWSKPIKTTNPWEPDFCGIFFKQVNNITFFFKDRTNLLAISESDQNAMTVYSCVNTDTLTLPRKWMVVEDAEASLILFGNNKGFDIQRKKYIHQIPASVQISYSNQVKPEKYYEEASFYFGEYVVSHKGNCGYVCKKSGRVIWEFSGKAYLYTEIVRWQNRLFFGTAGNSGYFYVLDIESGRPLVQIETGGTRSFVHIGNLCYVLANLKSAQLLCIDLTNGTIISQCNLLGKATSNSKLEIIDEYIHTITFEYLHSRLNGAVWSCIEVESLPSSGALPENSTALDIKNP